MSYSYRKIRAILLALRREMMSYLKISEEETDFCGRCLLPLPQGKFEAYLFCPWCSNSFNECTPVFDESRKVILNEYDRVAEIQCGECGCEYEQPIRYPFRFCVNCGAPFAAEDEVVIVLPFRVGGREPF